MTGGGGDLAALGVNPGETVVYIAPGGAIAAVAFLVVAAQATAAPLEPTIAQADALDALEQFGAAHVLHFDGAPHEAVLLAQTATCDDIERVDKQGVGLVNGPHAEHRGRSTRAEALAGKRGGDVAPTTPPE